MITDSSPNTQNNDTDTHAPARTHDKPHPFNLSTITDSKVINTAKTPPKAHAAAALGRARTAPSPSGPARPALPDAQHADFEATEGTG